MKKLQINVIFIAAAYSSCAIDVHLFTIDLHVPHPLLKHHSLACYRSCSFKTPYKVTGNDMENVLLAICWCLPMHDSSIADMSIYN